jgi:predicted CXXCH cytochrome family protein
MRTCLLLLLALGAAAGAASAAGAAESRLAPVPQAEAASTHGPYEMGACEACHQRHDAGNPGAAPARSNDLCFGCHDEFRGTSAVRLESTVHPGASADCTACHNPHNSRKKKLRL